jgi:hypothetical protein
VRKLTLVSEWMISSIPWRLPKVTKRVWKEIKNKYCVWWY